MSSHDNLRQSSAGAIQETIDADRLLIADLSTSVNNLDTMGTYVSRLANNARKVTKDFSGLKALLEECMKGLRNYVQIFLESPGQANGQREWSPSRDLYIAATIFKKIDVGSLGYSRETDGKLIVREFVEICCKLAKRPGEHKDLRPLLAISLILCRHPHQMSTPKVRSLYGDTLRACSFYGDDDTKVPNNAGCYQVLVNINYHILEEEALSIRLEANPDDEDLLDTDDCQIMGRTLVMIHLADILNTTFCTDVQVHIAAARLFKNMVIYGTIATNQLMAHLVLFCTDPCEAIASSSTKVLADFHQKCPEFLPEKLMDGVKMLHKFHVAVQSVQNNLPIRGWKKSGNKVTCIFSGVYSMIRADEDDRRSFMNSMLKLFDHDAKTPLRDLVLLADILAHLPYQLADEPYYLTYYLDFICMTTGGDLVDDWKQVLDASKGGTPRSNRSADSMAVDAAFRKDCVTRSHAFRLLLALRGFIRDVYDITDIKMATYSLICDIPGKKIKKRSRRTFQPTIVLDVIKRGEEDNEDPASNTKLAQEIIALKDMMMNQDRTYYGQKNHFDEKVASLSIKRRANTSRKASSGSAAKKRAK